MNTGPAITAYDVRYILSSASETDKADDTKWTEVADAWQSDIHTDLAYTIENLTQNTGLMRRCAQRMMKGPVVGQILLQV